MAGTEFRGRLEPATGGGAYVELPADVLDTLGGGARFRVTGRLNGIVFQSSTMAMGGGRVCLGVHKGTREAADVQFGDTVSVVVERDATPRGLELPDELATAFSNDPALRVAFDALSFTRRREHVESITSAKRPETRARRVAKVLDDLTTPRD